MTWISRTHVKHILDIYEVYRLLCSCLNIKQYTSASTHNQCRIHCDYTKFLGNYQVFFSHNTGGGVYIPQLKQGGFDTEELDNVNIPYSDC